MQSKYFCSHAHSCPQILRRMVFEDVTWARTNELTVSHQSAANKMGLSFRFQLVRGERNEILSDNYSDVMELRLERSQ